MSVETPNSTAAFRAVSQPGHNAHEPLKTMDATTTVPRRMSDHDTDPVAEESSQDYETDRLPPVDGGRHAWCFLIAIFTYEAVIWGLPYTFGIFQEYYSSHPLFANKPGIAAIGSTALGLMYLPAPLLSLALQRWPHYQKPCMIAGLLLTVASLVAASFSTTVPQLIGTQGAMFSLGGILAYFPGMQSIDSWFVARRATAFAIIWAGAPLAGAILPFIMRWLLQTHGFRTALRVYAVAVLLLLAPLMPFIKPRVPARRTAAPPPPLDFAFLRSQTFWWYAAGTTLHSFGFFLPSLWIPTFAADNHFPGVAGPLALALYNVAAFGGTVAQGWLVDRYHVSVDLALVTVVGTTSILLFWGLGTSQACFWLFAILWGCSGGAYNATWAGYAFDLRAEGFGVDTTFLITLMVFAKGVASVTCGPLSEALYGVELVGGAGGAYGGAYGGIVVYTGVCSLLGGVACLRPRGRKGV